MMKHLLTLAIALVVLADFPDLGAAQEKQEASPSLPCPIPMHVSLTAQTPQATTPNTADFPGAVSPANFGGAATNNHFSHTFAWTPVSKCCQYLSGKLTLHYQALQGGESYTSSDAGNDDVRIYSNGSTLLNQDRKSVV